MNTVVSGSFYRNLGFEEGKEKRTEVRFLI